MKLLPIFFLTATLVIVGCRQKSVVDTKTNSNAGLTENAETASASKAKPRQMGDAPTFQLTDQDGETFESSDLDGKVWVGTFIFTRCTTTCPLQTQAMSKLQTLLQNKNDLGRVQLISFSVDPEHDTPEVLNQYGKAFGADFDHWHFLTGSREQLWDLSNEGFGLPAASDRNSDEIVSHSQNFVLVDASQQIRGFYPALSPPAIERFKRDLETVIEEAFPNRGEEVLEMAHPEDVRDPLWLADRKAKQIQEHQTIDIKSDFQFTDRLEESGITFQDTVVEDVTRLFKAAHYDHGSGIAVADVDGDSKLDIYFVSQFGENELYRNLGEGRFENITESSGTGGGEAVSVSASFADIDNDGDADLYLTRVRAPNQLYLNDSTGKFKNVSATSGLDYEGHSAASTFFDYDRDGLLDCLLSNVGKYTTDEQHPSGYYLAYPGAFSGHLFEERNEVSILYHNEGDGRFTNVNEQVGLNDKSWSGDATPLDANDDGWPDLYLLDMQGHDEYYENQAGKRFVKKSRELFPKTAWGTMGVKVFDYNRDGQFDLFLTDMHTDMVHDLDVDEEKSKMRRNLPLNMLATDGNHILGNAFYEKVGSDNYVEMSDMVNAENYWPWGISVADLNADGFEDVFIASSMSFPYRYAINSVLLNHNGKGFVDSEFVLGVEPRSKGSALPWMTLDCSGADADNQYCKDRNGKWRVWGARGTRSSVIFDLEGDGDLDIVTNDFGDSPMVLVNNLSDQSELAYLQCELVGTQSNRDALGAIVQVDAGADTMWSVHDGKSGYLSQSRMPLYFGLAGQNVVDRITVTWPTGKQQTVDGPIETNQLIVIKELESDES